VLLEPPVSVHPEAQPAFRLFVEPNKLNPAIYLRCHVWQTVFLAALPARKQRCFQHCCVELLPWAITPLNAFRCISLDCHDDLIDIASSSYPAEILDKTQPLGWEVLFDPFDQS
jgi:hypothetical protein